MSVEFAKIVPLSNKRFGLQAGKEIPLQGVEGKSEDEVLGQLLTRFGRVAPGTILDVERLDHSHLKISNEVPAQELAPH